MYNSFSFMSINNAQLVKSSLGNNNDVNIKTIESSFGNCAIVYLSGIVKMEVVDKGIVQVIQSSTILKKKNLLEEIRKNVLLVPNCYEEKSLQSVASKVLQGEVALFIDGFDSAILADVSSMQTRSISEPPTSAVIKGPREGFTENIKINLSLIRRRLKSREFKVVSLQVGKVSKTEINVVYLDNIADKKIVKEIIEKIKEINIDGIIDSRYVEEFIKYRKNSIFKQIGTAEKPDIISAKLLEGRVAIIVDGSPIVLTVPFILLEDFQSSNDYYSSNYHVTMLRWLRYFGVAFSVVLPGFYVAMQLYHYSIVPLSFLITIQNSTQGLPFSPFFEILFVILLFEILNEASLRMPTQLGMALSIVGALILGDTAVKAGLISSPAVMIVALSGITIFAVPDQADQLALLRIFFAFLGGLLGIYGIIGGLFFITAYLSDFDSYNSPYLAPFSPRMKNDYKDFMIKKPLYQMMTRPNSIPNNNKVRIRSEINYN